MVKNDLNLNSILQKFTHNFIDQVHSNARKYARITASFYVEHEVFLFRFVVFACCVALRWKESVHCVSYTRSYVRHTLQHFEHIFTLKRLPQINLLNDYSLLLCALDLQSGKMQFLCFLPFDNHSCTESLILILEPWLCWKDCDCEMCECVNGQKHLRVFSIERKDPPMQNLKTCNFLRIVSFAIVFFLIDWLKHNNYPMIMIIIKIE